MSTCTYIYLIELEKYVHTSEDVTNSHATY